MNLKKRIKLILVDRETTLADWSKQSGFNPDMVHKVIERITKAPESKRHGTITKQIIQRLEKDFGAGHVV